MSAGEQPSNSLTESLAKSKIPVENHGFIRGFTDAIGIAGYYHRGDYIEAVRRAGGPNLYIHYGYTNGFISEAEVVRAAGNADREASARAGTWVVWHPINKKHASSARSADTRREPGLCPGCHMQLPATGQCDNCD